MKRFLFSVALALSLVTPIRSQTPDHTGAWWNSLSRPQRIAFVAGYLEASGTVSSSVFLRCLAEKNNGVVPEKAPSDAEIDRCSARAKALSVPKFQNQTFGQISDGIDKFYSDYR